MSVVELVTWRLPRVLPALRRVPTDRGALRRQPGLRFARLLGTGSGETFAPRDADLHRWALLTVWEDQAAAVRGRAVTAAWDDAASERLQLELRPLRSRGTWGGTEPFGRPDGPDVSSGAASVPPVGPVGPVAALTRARLRPTTVRSFRRAVPGVVPGLRAAPGLRLALGVGEWPVLLQGTFSVWSSVAALEDFAHRDPAHRQAVRRTRPARWYAEELFARFEVVSAEGTYEGTPL